MPERMVAITRGKAVLARTVPNDPLVRYGGLLKWLIECPDPKPGPATFSNELMSIDINVLGIVDEWLVVEQPATNTQPPPCWWDSHGATAGSTLSSLFRAKMASLWSPEPYRSKNCGVGSTLCETRGRSMSIRWGMFRLVLGCTTALTLPILPVMYRLSTIRQLKSSHEEPSFIVRKRL